MRYGLSVRDITPAMPMPMYGYGARTDPFDDVNDPLTFTAVVLEDNGRRALIGATDIGSHPEDARTAALLQRLGNIIDSPPENVMLNASHTHGGPLVHAEPLIHRAGTPPAVKRYEDWLFSQIEDATREAAANLADGSLWIAEGKTAIPMNRRPDRDGDVPNAPNPGGPIDDRLILFALRNAAGDLTAVGLRLSCHPVATGAQHRITADFPGAWRAQFSRAFGPAVTPFFLQGSGADARPRHVAAGDRWRTMKHSELADIGRDLLSETLQALTAPHPRRLDNLTLAGRLRTVSVPCEPRHVSRADFETLRAAGTHKRYVDECLRLLDAGIPVPDHQDFLVQTLWLDAETALLGINAEVLCGLGTAVEAAAAPGRGIMLGYTNGVLCYVPDTREMARGGYEAQSYLYRPWTGPMIPGIEHRFAAAVMRPGDAP